MRWHKEIHEAFYNGWKSLNGLKHQTINNAGGFVEDMYGPTSLRRNDLILLRDSNINDRFALGTALKIFGDSAYKVKSNLRSYFMLKDNTPAMKTWNNAMKKVRISIEWDYGATASLFKYICNDQKLKLLQDKDKVSKVYTVAILLRNFHIALYGCQTSNYFNFEIPPDMLEHYINQIDY